ncbi:23S rRNA (pseudouridine(1915)-N(3))-methyltransferase RlmH [Garciella nitratireducens]|uniref:23S rRNA (Pseudouridine1915-N3)-methyltransferase n=1 Tax=Garciella nitratireducens DSM 15102 TaxID=1121911 RepID=A0A1T4M9E8_9FIRM|nr:23S rRNA (pseudouridine(1915)-N(3))-methyltransferase RlmH [Garciella nitratireducens]SJZ63629.1 23S rRNA (pseudouridine1915-N3)-methyltransferase [Garciella nitratireducens DSM 15102]
MNIKIIIQEKIQKSFIKQGMEEYEKRLSKYCKINYIPLKKLEDLNKYIKEKTYFIMVRSGEKMISSECFAQKFQKWGLTGKSDIIFFITSQDVFFQPPHDYLSITSMDVDMELTTLILYEQIYRAFTILHHLPYHK